jgi:phospholipase D1/2
LLANRGGFLLFLLFLYSFIFFFFSEQPSFLFGSFSPPRFSACRWFVDGEETLAAIADAISQASCEIFLADWWIQPDIYLKRKEDGGINWRLDVLLERKAREGVSIYIMAWNAKKMATNIDIRKIKHSLQFLHPNITFLSHPFIVPISCEDFPYTNLTLT